MSMMERLRGTEVSTRTAALCIGVLLLLGAAVVMMAKNSIGGASAGPTVVNSKARPARAAVKVSETKPRTSKASQAGKSAAKAPKPKPTGKDPYLVIAERNIFQPLRQAPPPTSGNTKPPEPPKPSGGSKPLPTLPPMPVPVPPGGGANVAEFRKNIAFTGVVETRAGTQALLENIQSKETRFVGQGENAFGCRVVSISAKSVSLDKDGAQFSLNIGENKPDSDGGSKPSGGSSGQPEPGKGGPQPGR